ncbi:MAG: hypothetical protein HOH16_10860, partial [Planctomycetaceae bacterium]|nr:hypothetical protein [Planctomycetaceae bacterium]
NSKETVAANVDRGDLGTSLSAVSPIDDKKEKSLVAEDVAKPMPSQDITRPDPNGSAQESSSQVHDSTEAPHEQQSGRSPSEDPSQ